MLEKLFLGKKRALLRWKFRFWKKNERFDDEKNVFGSKNQVLWPNFLLLIAM